MKIVEDVNLSEVYGYKKQIEMGIIFLVIAFAAAVSWGDAGKALHQAHQVPRMIPLQTSSIDSPGQNSDAAPRNLPIWTP